MAVSTLPTRIQYAISISSASMKKTKMTLSPTEFSLAPISLSRHRLVLVYSGHGRRRYRPRRGYGQPQGSRTAHQGDSEPHALAGYDRWREPPRPTHTPFYGARHDRSRIP